VLWQQIAIDLTFREISKKLNTSIGTIYNIFKLSEKYWECLPYQARYKHPYWA